MLQTVVLMRLWLLKRGNCYIGFLSKLSHYRCAFLFFGLWVVTAKSQHQINAEATLNSQDHTVKISEQLIYKNDSQNSLQELYLNDWSNSFSNKQTPLAERFAENFKPQFHFEKDEHRGKTTIHAITYADNTTAQWKRTPQGDIIKIVLDQALLPGTSITITFSYTLTLAPDKFTRFGVTKNGNYKLKYWLLTPAVFDNKWHYYSNKNIDDLYQQPTQYSIVFNYPTAFSLTSDLDFVSEKQEANTKQLTLKGIHRVATNIYLERDPTFTTVLTDQIAVVSNLSNKKVSPPNRAILIDRIARFLNDNLGSYPHKKIIFSEDDYRHSPVYGFNLLPDFISPFPKDFELDIELLKTFSHKYIRNTLLLNPREDYWLIGAIQVYIMMNYVNTYYPDMKIAGRLSHFPIINWLHASDLGFNDQYSFLYYNASRNNLYQSLSTARDSLIKFNKNIANDYYAGQGMMYLSDYLGKEVLDTVVANFFKQQQLRLTSSTLFKEALQKNTHLPINWFFTDYVKKPSIIDYKITEVKKQEDSLLVTIRNKKGNKGPISLYGLNKREVVFKKWVVPTDSVIQVLAPKKGVKKLALNYNKVIPENNHRNNFKNISGFLNKPFQLRLLEDIEDPYYNQLFVIPTFGFNVYDGLFIGPKLFNESLQRKNLRYRLEPQYGLRSKMILGSASISYRDMRRSKKRYFTRYGISGNIFSFNQGLLFRRVSPFITLGFRDNHNLRSNERQFINIRNVTIFRDQDLSNPNQDPNYSVFNAQYVYANKNLINYYRGLLDYQISSKFSKISAQFEYRKLFNNNRQLNLRLFAGAFLYNKSQENGNFFSFALDRPTDYLFDYNYFGRSNDQGFFSQQIIIAEGGFKSQLTPAFANQFITTVNTGTTIWKWIHAYGDLGVVKNKGESLKGVFDTGIRTNFVADYLELYFPIYSNLGWEPALGNYSERIRFILTLDIQTLVGLFTREWY